MFGHRSFLVLDGNYFDLANLIKGGLEILHCSLSFRQGIDSRGKVTTRVYGGKIEILLSQLPNMSIIEWALKSRNYKNGLIVTLNHENIPIDKTIFEHATCTSFYIDYTQKGKSYSSTKLTIQAEKILVGDGIDFENEWSKN